MKKSGAAGNLPLSCRSLTATTLCPNPNTVPTNPLSWDLDCALGRCDNCPQLVVDLPDNEEVQCQFLQWKKGFSSKKDRSGDLREVTSLFPVSVSVREAAEMLANSIPRMKSHIVVAAHQYEALRERTDSLEAGDLISVEDFSMNYEVLCCTVNCGLCSVICVLCLYCDL